MFSALFFKESKLKHQETHTDSGDASKIQIATSGPVARCRWIQVDTGGYRWIWCSYTGIPMVCSSGVVLLVSRLSNYSNSAIPESSVFISFLCPIPLTCLCVLASAVGIVGSLQWEALHLHRTAHPGSSKKIALIIGIKKLNPYHHFLQTGSKPVSIRFSSKCDKLCQFGCPICLAFVWERPPVISTQIKDHCMMLPLTINTCCPRKISEISKDLHILHNIH